VRTAIAVLIVVSSLPAAALAAATDTAAAARVAGADAARGQTSFLQCTACHVAAPSDQPRLGPNLWGVVGRAVASVSGYDYTGALRALGGEWSYARLEEYLRAPMDYAPGTRMVFPGIADAATRADVIAYLRTRSDDPPPLPAAAPAPGTHERSDPFGADWPQGPGREVTGSVCNVCHSLTMVKQQGLPRWRWDELLDWMVEEQGMAPLDPGNRALVLDYLTQNFGIKP
jgi:cytochrome c